MTPVNQGIQQRIFILLVLALSCCLSACRPAKAGTPPPESPVPALGDRWKRPADGMEIVFLPAGEFSMGSDREMVENARKLCNDSGGDMALATCRSAAFADEQPTHNWV